MTRRRNSSTDPGSSNARVTAWVANATLVLLALAVVAILIIAFTGGA